MSDPISERTAQLESGLKDLQDRSSPGADATPPPPPAAPQPAAPDPATSDEAAPPPWVDVTDHPDYQSSTPEEKLITFSRWHDAAYNALQSAPDWNKEKDRFNKEAAETQTQLSKDAGNVTPDQARVNIAEDELNKAQATTPDAERTVLKTLGDDVAGAYLRHKTGASVDELAAANQKPGYMTDLARRFVFRDASTLNHALAWAADKVAPALDTPVGALGTSAKNYFRHNADLVDAAYAPNSGLLDPNNDHTVGAAVADALGTTMATVPATLAAMAVPEALLPAAATRVATAVGLGVRAAGLLTKVGQLGVGMLPVAGEFAASSADAASSAFLHDHPGDQDGAQKAGAAAALETAKTLPFYMAGGALSGKLEQLILPKLMAPALRGVSRFISGTIGNIAADEGRKLAEGQSLAITPADVGVAAGYALHPALEAPHTQAHLNEQAQAAQDIAKGVNPQLLVFQILATNPDADPKIRGIAAQNAQAMVTNATKFLSDNKIAVAPLTPAEQSFLSGVTNAKTANDLRQAGAPQTANAFEAAVPPAAPEQPAQTETFQTRAEAEKFIDERKDAFTSHTITETAGQPIQVSYRLKEEPKPAQATPVTAPPAPATADGAPSLTTQLDAAGNVIYDHEIPANATPDQINAHEAEIKAQPGIPADTRARMQKDIDAARDRNYQPPAAAPAEPKAKIAGSVLTTPDGDVLAEGPLGTAHADLTKPALEKMLADNPGADPGKMLHQFRDDQGNVLDRQHAWDLAKAAGQIKPEVLAAKDKPGATLHSQDLITGVDASPVATPKIIAAAIKDPETGELFTGPSHPQIYDKFPQIKGEPDEAFTGEGWNTNGKYVDGFVDQNGRFYDREEAGALTGVKGAEAVAGKIPRDTPYKIAKDKPGELDASPTATAYSFDPPTKQQLDELVKQAAKGQGRTPAEKATAVDNGTKLAYAYTGKTGYAPEWQMLRRFVGGDSAAAKRIKEVIQNAIPKKWPAAPVPEGATVITRKYGGEEKGGGSQDFDSKDEAEDFVKEHAKSWSSTITEADGKFTVKYQRIPKTVEIKQLLLPPDAEGKRKVVPYFSNDPMTEARALAEPSGERTYVPDSMIATDRNGKKVTQINPAIEPYLEWDEQKKQYYVGGVDTPVGHVNLSDEQARARQPGKFGDVGGTLQQRLDRAQIETNPKAQQLTYLDPEKLQAVNDAVDKEAAEFGLTDYLNEQHDKADTPAGEDEGKDNVGKSVDAETDSNERPAEVDPDSGETSWSYMQPGTPALVKQNFQALEELGVIVRGQERPVKFAVETAVKAMVNDKSLHVGQRNFAALILRSKIDLKKIPFRIVSDATSDYAGTYNPQTSEIIINPAGEHVGGSPKLTLLHEVVHHVLNTKLEENFARNPIEERAYQNLKRIFEQANKAFPADQIYRDADGMPHLRDYYGLKNLREFAAETIANDKFGRILDQLSRDESLVGQPTGRFHKMIQDFKRAVKNLIVGQEVRPHSLYDDALDNLFTLVAQGRRVRPGTAFTADEFIAKMKEGLASSLTSEGKAKLAEIDHKRSKELPSRANLEARAQEQHGLSEDEVATYSDSDLRQLLANKTNEEISRPAGLDRKQPNIQGEGWVTPDGMFVKNEGAGNWGGHQDTAHEIIDHDPKLTQQYQAWLKSHGAADAQFTNDEKQKSEEFLQSKGFLRVVNYEAGQLYFTGQNKRGPALALIKDYAAKSGRQITYDPENGARPKPLDASPVATAAAPAAPPAKAQLTFKNGKHDVEIDPEATPAQVIGLRHMIADHPTMADATRADLKRKISDTVGPYVAGQTSRAQGILGLNTFLKEDLFPKVNKNANAAVAAKDLMINLLAPTTRARTKDLDVLFAGKGMKDELMFRANAAMEDSRKMMSTLPRTEQLAFIDRVKRGEDQPTPELQATADLMRNWDDAIFDLMKQYKPGLPYLENHLRVLWKTVPGSPEAMGANAAGILVGKRPWQGTRGMFKQHTLESMSEGIALGGEPVTYNPVEMQILSMQDATKFISAQRIWDGLKKTGAVEFVKAGHTVPDGFTQLKDSISKVYFKTDEGLVSPGEYWINEGIGRLLNNHLGRDYWRENALGRGLLDFKNATTAVELGMSPFHAVFETNEVIGSSIGLAISKIASGRFADGFRDLLGAGTSFVSTAKLGGTAIEFAKDPAAFAAADPDRYNWFIKKYPGAQDLINDLFSGGGRLEMHEDYKILAAKGFREALTEGNYAGVVMRAVPALNAQVMKPLFEQYIPRLKLGMFLREHSFELSRRADDLASGKITRGELSRQTWNFVEDRFGELNWDNLFWNRVFKSGMMFGFRSVTWKLGNIRGFGKAANDSVRELGVDWWKEGRAPRVTAPMGWLVGMSIVTAIQSAIISKVTTGKYPWDLATSGLDLVKQLAFPRIDALDPTQRVSIPTYWRDAVHLAHDPTGYVRSSMTGEIGRATDIWNNRDFYGTEVYHPDDPIWKKGVDVMAHAVPLPFGVQSYLAAHKQGETNQKSALGFLGFSKAAYHMSHTPAEIEASTQVRDKLPQGSRTKAEFEKSQRERQAVQMIKRGDLSMPDAIAEGLIPREHRKTATQAVAQSPLQHALTHLTDPEASMKVMRKASPAELKDISQQVWLRIVRSKSIDSTEKDTLKKEWMDIMKIK